MRAIEQKLECIRKVIINSQEHIRANDPPRVYSQYIRYALDEFSRLNFYVSEEAKGLKRRDVIYDHVIPHSILMKKLLMLDFPTAENIWPIVERYYVICAITKNEDKLLTKNGLRSSMPEGWNEETGSVFARYERVGISIFGNQ